MAAAPAIRAVGPAELAACLRLSALAGWNQNEADWRWMMAAGQVFGIDADGTLVATALTLPYGGRFAWISMVLVDPACRHQGLATRLMRHAVATLDGAGLVPLLDATPAGREVYRRLGFRDTWTMQRWRLPEGGPADPASAVAPLAEADWPAVAALDRAAFGADRLGLLRHLAGRLPRAALAHRGGGGPDGFCLAREGRTADQIGPVVAQGEAAALALIRAALARQPAGRAVYLDVPDRWDSIARLLAGLGGRIERPYTRMVHGRDRGFDDPDLLYAVAGPELG